MVECPFGCRFSSSSKYATQIHVEECHSENPSFEFDEPHGCLSSQGSRVDNGSNQPHLTADHMWTRCTRPGCGEYIMIYDVDDHLDMHAAIALAETDKEQPSQQSLQQTSLASSERQGQSDPNVTSSMTTSITSPRKPSKENARPEIAARPGNSLLRYFSGTSSSYNRASGRFSGRPTYRQISRGARRAPGRLGKRELGPYAFEEIMPNEVRRQLIEGSAARQVNHIGRDGRLSRQYISPNETAGIIPVLADMCALSRDTSTAYFCHPSTRHIHRIPCNGNFCGYWSIQVLMSYLQTVRPDWPQEVPNVLKIQSYIHQAWDRGICPHGKVETGGILNTRKWIGTHEALAFFTRIEVQVDALGFGGQARGANNAAVDLLDHVEAYFMSGANTAESYGKTHITKLSPIYLQRFGHSMTIVGLERLVDGSRKLLVFDSSFATSVQMKRLASQQQALCSLEGLLRPYRKSDLSLTRFDEFEIIVPHASINNYSPDSR